MRPLHVTILTLLVVLGAGCRRSSPVSGPSLEEARALALAAPGGEGLVDREIVRLQERLRRVPAADDWVLVGQAWVQKARRAGDPGLVLGAEGASIAAL